jgi:hypothetical protein
VLTVDNKFKVRKSTMCIDVEMTGDLAVIFGVYFSSLLYRTLCLDAT